MSKAYNELKDAIRQCIEYEKGNSSEVIVHQYNEPVQNLENLKLHINEQYESTKEHFEEFEFNPNDSWRYIYNDVIDPIVEKYWNCSNRKRTIEDKVYEFYKMFKQFANVDEAYIHFLRSDRLFED